jgi:hypothetical protein
MTMERATKSWLSDKMITSGGMLLVRKTHPTMGTLPRHKKILTYKGLGHYKRQDYEPVRGVKKPANMGG